mgnify:CR=1 FL=1
MKRNGSMTYDEYEPASPPPLSDLGATQYIYCEYQNKCLLGGGSGRVAVSLWTAGSGLGGRAARRRQSAGQARRRSPGVRGRRSAYAAGASGPSPAALTATLKCATPSVASVDSWNSPLASRVPNDVLPTPKSPRRTTLRGRGIDAIDALCGACGEQLVQLRAVMQTGRRRTAATNQAAERSCASGGGLTSRAQRPKHRLGDS